MVGKKKRRRPPAPPDESIRRITEQTLIQQSQQAMQRVRRVCTCCKKTKFLFDFSRCAKECIQCQRIKSNRSIVCGVCNELKSCKEYTRRENQKDGGGITCKSCMAVPTIPDDEFQKDLLKSIGDTWNYNKGSGQSPECINACIAAIGMGIDIRVITCYVRKRYVNIPITTPYYNDRIKGNIEKYLRKHLSAAIFRVVHGDDRVVRNPSLQEIQEMEADLNSVLNLDPITGKPLNKLPRDFGNPLRETVRIYAICTDAIQQFQGMNYEADMFNHSIEINEFAKKNELEFDISRTRLDQIIANAEKENPDPKFYLQIIQEKLVAVLLEHHPDEKRSFLFYSTVNYWAARYCPPEVKRDLLESNNPDLVDLGETAVAIKCGHSMSGIIRQNKKMLQLMCHTPGKWGRVVTGVLVGSPTSSFAGEQALHLYHKEHHKFGEHQNIHTKLNSSITHFQCATHSTVIFVSVVGDGMKLYQTPTTNNDGEGKVYETQRIADPRTRALVRTLCNGYTAGTDPHNWCVNELASKCGSSLLISKDTKDIEAYLKKHTFWSGPYKAVAYAAHATQRARRDEVAFHKHLFDIGVKHVSGEVFATGVDITAATSALQSFVGSENVVESGIIENTKHSETYRKLSLQQYLQSGIITRDHLLDLWKKGIIERC